MLGVTNENEVADDAGKKENAESGFAATADPVESSDLLILTGGDTLKEKDPDGVNNAGAGGVVVNDALVNENGATGVLGVEIPSAPPGTTLVAGEVENEN